VFLDACRDNPALFKNLVKGRGGSPAGLAPAASSNFEQKPGGGIFIAYATDAGAIADDGNGKHSPFTQALLRNIQKPISIDDMFSLVTKEVRLVTRNAQRPYKYASLENIVCVAPNCSSFSNSASIAPIEQAQRSEADELEVAIESKKVAALEAFLEKYPDTPRLSEVKNVIGSLKRTDFTDWTLFAVGDKRIPWYVQLSSIQRLPDRAAIKVRHPVDPTLNKVFMGRPFPDAEYVEDVNAYSCDKSISLTSEETIFDKAMTVLYHYKFGDFRYLNLSAGISLAAGSVGDAIRVLACNDSIGTPSVGKDRLSLMNFRSLSSTVAGDGDLFFEPLRDLDGNSNEKDLLFIFRFFDERKILLPIEPAAVANLVDLNNLPDFRTQIDNVRLLCKERKLASIKSEFYDASNKLVYMTARDPKLKIDEWIEIKEATTQSPLTSLYRIFCNSGEATK
jgi:Caspase domain